MSSGLKRCVTTVHVADEVGFDDLHMGLEWCLGKFSDSSNARVIDPDIDATIKGFYGFCGKALNRFAVCRIGWNANGMRTEPHALLGHLEQVRFISRSQHEVCALFGKLQSYRATDATGRSRDDDGRMSKVSLFHPRTPLS